MNSQKLDERAIFSIARRLDAPEARAEYLQQACGDNHPLRDRVSALLRGFENGGSFLESPASDLVATLDLPPLAERPGTTIGRYKLLQEIGEGGMGVVYMAEQREPVRRKVALKIIKPGMDSRQVIARFEAERQTLAVMDHPNVAHVLDGGATDSGRPYFVMELVHGVPITEFCDQNGLTTRERLELFVQVCQAVQHAHQKGIIHRDLKPSNVLVTLRDGAAVPKIIDFGIAKATNQQLTDKTVFTGFGQMVGTPLYMSPEQAEMNCLDVDTRSDIYSLGVLLYELLTGATPFDQERLREAGLDEVRRVIREEEPPRPSHRLSTLDAAALSTITGHRGVDARRLGHLLCGDLDWIVMRALEKDRTRRYEAASAFAKDVQRYLDDEPVDACPPSAAYRFNKFARRNKTALVTVLAVALALVVTAGLAGWQAIVATDANNLANERLEQVSEQRQRVEANLQLALQALDELCLNAIGERKLLREERHSIDSETWLRAEQEISHLERELLERGLAFYDRFAQQNQDNPRAAFETGKAFYRLALLHSGLEEHDGAQEAYFEAINRLKRLTEQHPSESKYFLELGKAYYGQGQLSRWRPSATDTLADAFAHAKEALNRAIELAPGNTEAYRVRSVVHGVLADREAQIADLRTAIRIAPKDAAEAPQLHSDYLNLGKLLSRTGRPGEAEKAYRDAIAIAEKVRSAFPTDEHYADQYAASYGCLIDLLTSTGRREEAHRIFLGMANPRGAGAYGERGEIHLAMREYDKALADFTEGVRLDPNAAANLVWIPMSAAMRCPDKAFRQGLLQLVDKAMEADDHDGGAYAAKARLLGAFGREEEALASIREAFHRIPEGTSPYEFSLLIEAIGEVAHSEKAIPYLRRLSGFEPGFAYHWYYSALAQLGGGLSDSYGDTCRRMLRHFQDTGSSSERRLVAWTSVLGPDVLEKADYTRVVRIAERAVDASTDRDDCTSTLGAALYRAGQPHQAVQSLSKAAAQLQEPCQAAKSSPAYTWFFLAMAHHRLGHSEEAKQWFDKAVTSTEKILADADQGNADVPWNRRLTLKLLRDEATALLKSAPATVPEKPAPKAEEQPNEQHKPEEQVKPADAQPHE